MAEKSAAAALGAAAIGAMSTMVLMGSGWYFSSKTEDSNKERRGSLSSGLNRMTKVLADLEKENAHLRQTIEELRRKLEAAEVAAMASTERERKGDGREQQQGEGEEDEASVEVLQAKIAELEEENVDLHQLLQDTRAVGDDEAKRFEEERAYLLKAKRDLEEKLQHSTS